MMGAIALLAAVGGTAQAQTQAWTLNFNPEATGATGTGSGRITLTGNLLNISLTFSGLSGPTSIAHIHCCTAAPFTGTVGVATRTPSFEFFPAGVTAGTFNRTFDLALNQDVAAPTSVFWNPAFVTANGGSFATATTALLAGMNSGRAYFNIHTTTFPNGEIRAFTQVVPEPGTYALLAVGLGGVAVAARGRRRAAT